MSADDYRRQLRSLLPRGLPWSAPVGGVLDTLLSAWGDGLTRVHAYLEGLLDEADPRTTTALLPEWERVAGLDAGSQTTAQRRAAVVGQLTATGGASRAYFVQVLAGLGYTATITEYRPHTVESDVDYPLYDQPWAWRWLITAHAGSGAASPAAVEALINRIKPAHTEALFTYI